MPIHQLQSRQAFTPSCPLGGLWYACSSGSYFTGCCDNEPCTLGCKAGNIRPASFDARYYGKFPDALCDDTGSQFYTCTGTTTPFLGCCKVNACQNNGCPTEDLTAARLPANPVLACQYYSTGCASVASSTSSPAPAMASSKHFPTGAVVGGTVGGVAGLLFLLLLLYCYRRARRSRNEQNERANWQTQSSQFNYMPVRKQPDITPSTRYDSPVTGPLNPSSYSPTLLDTQSQGSPPQPSSEAHRSRHLSYELAGSAAEVSTPPAGLGFIYDPHSTQPNMVRRPISTSPFPSELSTD